MPLYKFMYSVILYSIAGSMIQCIHMLFQLFSMPYFQFNYNHNIKPKLVEIRLQKKFSALYLQPNPVLTLEGD